MRSEENSGELGTSIIEYLGSNSYLYDVGEDGASHVVTFTRHTFYDSSLYLVPKQHDGIFHVFTYGDLSHAVSPHVRIHSSCVTGETFGSLACECREQLDYAFRVIHESGAGMIIYLYQEGRNLGLMNKLRIYKLAEEKGMTTFEACDYLGIPRDMRSYDQAVAALHYFGLADGRELSILTNSPDKVRWLEHRGFPIVPTPIIIPPNSYNEAYLRAKQEVAGHTLGF